MQLEGWGDVEKATDRWPEAQGTGRARAVQGEGLQDSGDEEEQLRSSQAFPEADTLPWKEEDTGLGKPSSHHTVASRWAGTGPAVT